MNASFEKSCKKNFFNSISQKRSPYYEEVTKLIPFVLMSFMLGSFFLQFVQLFIHSIREIMHM